MKHILSILLLTLFSLNVSADIKPQSEPFQSIQNIEKTQKCQALKADGANQEQLVQRGCCSWHKGVCGCSGGRASCCDGTLSPSCGCHKDDEGKSEI